MNLMQRRVIRGFRIIEMLTVAFLLTTGAAGAADIYWTGAVDDYWHTPGNWWDPVLESSRVPDEADTVRLGHPDHATANRHYDVILNDTATVFRLYFAGTEDRTVRLSSQDNHELIVTANTTTVGLISTATAQGFVDLPIHMNGDKPHVFNNTTNSVLVIDDNGRIRASSPDRTGAGDIEVRGMLEGAYRVNANTGTLIMNTGGDHFANSWNPSDNTSMALKTDSGVSLYLGGGAGRTEMYIIESGDNDRTFTVGTHIRGVATKTIALVDSPDGSTGHLTFRAYHFRDDSLEVETGPNSTVEIYGGSGTMNASDNAGISGSGNLLLKRTSPDIVFGVRRAMTYTGRTMLETGILRLQSAETYTGQLPVGTILEIGEDATLDLSGINQTVGGLTGFRGRNEDQPETFGTVALGGATFTVNAAEASAFGGAIIGTGTLVKAGTETWSLTAGYTNAAGRTLRIEDGLLAVTGALSVEDGTFELAGGRLTSGSLASTGTVWEVTLHAANEGQTLVTVAGNADITEATLELMLAGGYSPEYGREYTLLYAGGIAGAAPGGLLFGQEEGVPFVQGGQEYVLHWENGSEKIVLTAIPEPGSLVLLGLAAAAGLARRRSRRFFHSTRPAGV